jgi:hypothetical protein
MADRPFGAMDPIPAPQPGGVSAYADMVIGRGPAVTKAELIRLQCKIMEAQQQISRGDPMAAARALRS